MSKHVIVIGGGVAGLESAGRLSKAGFDVTVVENSHGRSNQSTDALTSRDAYHIPSGIAIIDRGVHFLTDKAAH